MAIPIGTNRATPRGAHLRDGYQTVITFENDPRITFWEKTTKPPGFDGGEKIDETTMHNTLFRTFQPRSLITVTDSTLTVAYDAVLYLDIDPLLNVNQTITVTFRNGDQVAFYGFLQKFEPNECKEGEQPDAQITIVATNVDPDDFTEFGPSVSTSTTPSGIPSPNENSSVIVP